MKYVLYMNNDVYAILQDMRKLFNIYWITTPEIYIIYNNVQHVMCNMHNM